MMSVKVKMMDFVLKKMGFVSKMIRAIALLKDSCYKIDIHLMVRFIL